MQHPHGLDVHRMREQGMILTQVSFHDTMEDGGRLKRQYFKAVCSECGQECEVPFKPTQGKKVYCNECYRKYAPPRDDRRRRF